MTSDWRSNCWWTFGCLGICWRCGVFGRAGQRIAVGLLGKAAHLVQIWDKAVLLIGDVGEAPELTATLRTYFQTLGDLLVKQTGGGHCLFDRKGILKDAAALEVLWDLAEANPPDWSALSVGLTEHLGADFASHHPDLVTRLETWEYPLTLEALRGWLLSGEGTTALRELSGPHQ